MFASSRGGVFIKVNKIKIITTVSMNIIIKLSLQLFEDGHPLGMGFGASGEVEDDHLEGQAPFAPTGLGREHYNLSVARTCGP